MNKEDMKKWTKLIIIAALAYLIVSNIGVVGNIISLVISIDMPNSSKVYVSVLYCIVEFNKASLTTLVISLDL